MNLRVGVSANQGGDGAGADHEDEGGPGEWEGNIAKGSSGKVESGRRGEAGGGGGGG